MGRGKKERKTEIAQIQTCSWVDCSSMSLVICSTSQQVQITAKERSHPWTTQNEPKSKKRDQKPNQKGEKREGRKLLLTPWDSQGRKLGLITKFRLHKFPRAYLPSSSHCGGTADLIRAKYTCHHQLTVYLDRTKPGRPSRSPRLSICTKSQRNRHHTHPTRDGATTVTSSQAVEM